MLRMSSSVSIDCKVCTSGKDQGVKIGMFFLQQPLLADVTALGRINPDGVL